MWGLECGRASSVFLSQPQQALCYGASLHILISSVFIFVPSKYFHFSFWFAFWLMGYLEISFVIFFSHILLLLKSSLILLWSENILRKKIKSYIFDMWLILIPVYVPLWWMFHVLLKRRGILLFGGMFYKCYLGQIYWWCYSSLLEPYWFSVYLFCYWESSIKSL